MDSCKPESSKSSELDLLAQIKQLDEKIFEIREEKDRIALQLASSQAENMRLKAEVLCLQRKLEILQPKTLLTRIEKTLEIVELMDCEEISESDLKNARAKLDTENFDNTKEEGFSDDNSPTDGINPDDSLKIKVLKEIGDLHANELLKIEVEEEDSGDELDKVDQHLPEEDTSEHEKAKVCLACDYVYEDPLDYRKHLKTVHGLKYKHYKCFHCSRILQRHSALEKHLKRHHKNAPKPGIEQSGLQSGEDEEFDEKTKKSKHKVYRKCDRTMKHCILCGFSSLNRADISRHGQSVHGFTENYRPCNQCDYVASNTARLNKHVRIKHMGVKNKCEECGEEFEYETTLRKHRDKVHRNRRYKCEFCDHVATQSDNLKAHVDARHNNIKYYCDKCNYTATSRSALSTHIKNRHGHDDDGNSNAKSETQIYCDKCSFSTFYRWSLALHVKRQHGEDYEGKFKPPPEKKFHCDQCLFSAVCNSALKEHIAVKHEGKLYQCDKCDFSAMAKPSLKRHLLVKHPDVQSQQLDNYKCEVCDATFVDLANFQRHQRRRLQKTNTTLYKCDICQKVFCFEIGVNKHKRRVHSSEGDLIPCDECDKVFYSQQNLNRHKRTTHRLEKFKCLECDKNFTCKQYLNKHMREKHMVITGLQN